MITYSQAGQDIFVRQLIKRTGTFLDIGAAGLSISNTLALEQEGWMGWLVDNSPEAQAASLTRTAKFILGDATTLDYSFLPPVVDYLSLDVDRWSMDALRRIPLEKVQFRVITAEHDAYTHGDKYRGPMLRVLSHFGYQIHCENVCHQGMPFEIWATHPMHINDPIRITEPTEWSDLL